MWIDKAVEDYSNNKYFLFEEFFNNYGFNNIQFVERKVARDEEVYIIKATHYPTGTEKTFYFGDFSVMTDVMENKSYAIKNSHTLIDTEWGLVISSKLKKEDAKQYKKAFKEYHKKQLEQEKDWLKTF